MPLTVTPDALAKSAQTFRRELLMMPTRNLGMGTQYMTPRPGVTYAETVGELTGTFELGPYSNSRKAADDLKIEGRTLYTFLGSVMKDFDPNVVCQTIYGTIINKGDALKSVNISQQVLVFLMKQLGENLYNALWSAKRDDAGTTTKTLFNGFDTITSDEITAATISAAKGNYQKFTEAITSVNAYNMLNDFYEAVDDKLQEQDTILFVPISIYNAYRKDYKSLSSGISYNTSFDQTYLESSGNRCRIIPMSCKKGSKYIHLTTKANMLYGFGNGADQEQVLVDRFSSLVLTFTAVMFFGTQFESINKERLCVGELYSA